MPTQFFNADEQSAARVTTALVDQFQRQGYRVVPMERTQPAFQSMGLEARRDIADPKILEFGRNLQADLVVHPQLLAVGIPAADSARAGAEFRPTTVLYLRVLNTRTGKNIYTRQIGHRFSDTRGAGAYSLPQPIAAAAVTDGTRLYFERVAGSRQETGQPAR
jgi:hypothetical protein